MCYRTGSTASATMVCSPARNEKLISQRLGPYLARKPPNRMTHQSPRSPLSHCENHAPIAAGKCASSRLSGPVKNRNPAHHPERQPHDETHVTIQRPYPEKQRVPGRYRLSETEFTMFKGLELSETRLANGRESSSNQLQNHTTSTHYLNTLGQSPQSSLNAFPIGLNQTPRLPPSHVSQRGPP